MKEETIAVQITDTAVASVIPADLVSLATDTFTGILKALEARKEGAPELLDVLSVAWMILSKTLGSAALPNELRRHMLAPLTEMVLSAWATKLGITADELQRRILSCAAFEQGHLAPDTEVLQ